MVRTQVLRKEGWEHDIAKAQATFADVPEWTNTNLSHGL
jgi:hypothetical protein